MTDPWSPWRPSPAEPWNLRRVVLLHRRAGFAATWEELQRDLADGPEASVERLLRGTSRARPREDFEETQANLAAAAIQKQDVRRLQAWWIYRMLYGPDPLGEQLTLLWHNHFATSQAKVQDVALMHAQNETLRRNARATFGNVLLAMLSDPALLVWLDAPENRKAHPNENLARELMELFTLGVGPFGEADVKESARALTGWSLRRDACWEDAAEHDDGEKRVLGRTGAFRAPDLAKILLEHPATSERLAGRILELLLAEGVATAELRGALAADLRAHELDVGRAVGLVLRSATFFGEANLAGRVASPVEFVVGLARALELDAERVSTLLLADWAARMGQELFLPPNVGGWKGGRAWLDTQSLVQRANFADAAAHGELLPGRRDWLAWARAHGASDTGDDGGAALLELVASLLCGSAVPARAMAPAAARDPAAIVGALLAAPELLVV